MDLKKNCGTNVHCSLLARGDAKAGKKRSDGAIKLRQSLEYDESGNARSTAFPVDDAATGVSDTSSVGKGARSQ